MMPMKPYLSHSQQDFDLLLNFVTNEQTLADVLQEQIATCLHPLHKELAEFIVNSLDGNGYLQLKDEDIQRMLPQYSLDDIEDTINEIQTLSLPESVPEAFRNAC